MTEIRYWLWLTLKKGLSCRKITLLLEHFKTPKDIYCAEEAALLKIPGLEPKERKAVADKSLQKAEEVIGVCKKRNIKILTFDSPYYPRLLSTIYDPPYVLYARYRERIDLNEHATISVVGTRAASTYGKNAAVSLSKALAEQGMTVVSGMASGIDSAAANGALLGGGKTIAVLGCGVDRCYPAHNRKLMEKIIAQGMVLSEFPPGTPPYSSNFPVRNRIITGLSLGTIVVEAPKTSGALISAGMAAEQNREVFAVPGDITRNLSKGSNALLQDGAKPVLEAEDILCEFRELYGELMEKNLPKGLNRADEASLEKNKATIMAKHILLSESEKKVMKILSDKPTHIDRLAEQGIPPAELSAALTTLELKGMVKALPGKQYQLSL